MSSEETTIWVLNQNQKSDKAIFFIYADLECLIEKVDVFKNNPDNSTTTKIGEDTPSRLSTILPFKSIEYKHDVYRGRDSIEKVLGIVERRSIKDD